MADIKTNKKANAQYWDEIEDLILELIKKISKFSTSDKKIFFDEGAKGYNCDNPNHVFYDVYEEGLLPSIRDQIVEELENNGASFPFVDENF